MLQGLSNVLSNAGQLVASALSPGKTNQKGAKINKRPVTVIDPDIKLSKQGKHAHLETVITHFDRDVFSTNKPIEREALRERRKEAESKVHGDTNTPYFAKLLQGSGEDEAPETCEDDSRDYLEGVEFHLKGIDPQLYQTCQTIVRKMVETQQPIDEKAKTMQTRYDYDFEVERKVMEESASRNEKS